MVVDAEAAATPGAPMSSATTAPKPIFRYLFMENSLRWVLAPGQLAPVHPGGPHTGHERGAFWNLAAFTASKRRPLVRE